MELWEEAAIEMFVGGLSKEIRRMVLLLHTKYLREAFAMARLQEDNYQNMSSSITSGKSLTTLGSRPFSRFDSKSNGARPIATAASGLLPLPASAVTYNQGKASTSRGARTYFNMEINEKRAKGLCFWCNEKYEPGYNCSKKHIYLMEIEEDAEGIECSEEDEVMETEAQLSIHALIGSAHFQTMRVVGQVGKKPLHILIDSSSTHNFLDREIGRKLGCALYQNKCFKDVNS